MAADFSVLSVLPEFNMEKNMPVEDDDNLDKKKDEWWLLYFVSFVLNGFSLFRISNVLVSPLRL